MNGLALCAGLGGLELGLSIAIPGYRTVCFCERSARAASNLVARMEDSTLDKAPIWDDLTTFDGAAWRGVVDIVTAGFPCQPFSVAGRQRGVDDERWIWEDIAKIIGDSGPGFVFLENVPGIVTAGLEHILRSMAELGYDATWGYLRALDVGAPHRRRRWFLLAYRNDSGRPRERLLQFRDSWSRWSREDLVSAEGQIMANASCEGGAGDAGVIYEEKGQDEGRAPEADHEPWDPIKNLFPPTPENDAAWERYLSERPVVEPAIRRTVDGLAERVEQLRLCGNGVVPLQAAYAFASLTARAIQQ